MKKLIILVLLALLLPALTLASPDEAIGKVTHVVDGNTFDVQLQSHNSRIAVDNIRIRLADVDSPELGASGGDQARDYAYQWLQDRKVYLDLDDKTGKDQYDHWVAVVYLANPDGSLNTTQNFNRMLVDSGNACVWDFTDNEFKPADWWGGFLPTTVCIKSDSTTASSTGSTRLGGSSTIGTDIFNSQKTSQSSYSSGSSGYSSSTPAYSSSDGPFVGSAKSDKYHYPSCRAAKQIKSSNLVTFSSSAEAKAAGYVPCGICHPP